MIQGTLLVIPIEESLLYIRPLYLRGQGGRIPELKRVIVAYQGTIVMEPTLEQALERLFGGERRTSRARRRRPRAPAARRRTAGGATADGGFQPTAPLAQALADARTHYDNARRRPARG